MSATLTLAAPVMLQPMLSQGVLSTNAPSLPILVQADEATVALRVVVTETGTAYLLSKFTTSGNLRHFAGDILLPASQGSYTLNITAQDAMSSPTQVSPTVQVPVLVAPQGDVQAITPPESIRVHRLYDRVRLEWVSPDVPGFMGVRVRTSSDSSGVLAPYTQLGYLIPNNDTRSEMVVVSSATGTQLVPDPQLPDQSRRVTTVQEVLRRVDYSTVDIFPKDVDAEEFYVTLATVVQDLSTFQVYESSAAGPLRCAFVNLRTVSPADFPPISQPEQIATDIVRQQALRRGDLDLSPRSELRDLQIDPFALELANATVRNWFTRVSSSLSALVQIDDLDGDGISDPPATSPYKQTLARAFRLTDEQVQAVIDNAFNVQAEQAGVPRGGPQAAIVPVTFYVKDKPTERMTVGLNTLVSTMPDSDVASVTYSSLTSATIDPDNLEAYWIPSVNGWGVTIACQATVTGSVGSVGAGAIQTIISGTSAAMKCINLRRPDFDGTDTERNTDLATRIFIRRETGIDAGRVDGYVSTARRIPGVVDVQAVQSGDLEMLRDWDPVRNRHTYGCVDVYARGAMFGQGVQDQTYLCSGDGTWGVPTSYTPLAFAGISGNRIKFLPPAGETRPLAAVVEVYVERATAVYLGVQHAVMDPVTGAIFLNPDDPSYTYAEDGAVVPGALNRTWLASLAGARVGALLRYWTPLEVTPSLQPVTAVTSIVGNGATGSISTDVIELDRTASDPLLEGNSLRAKDMIRAVNDTVLAELTLQWLTNGPDTLDLGEGVTVDEMGPVDANGVPLPGNILSVRSQDASSLYTFGVDYAILPLGGYGHMAIRRLPGSTIPLDSPVLVAFNRRRIREALTTRLDRITLSGTTPVTLTSPGFLRNTWVAASHGVNVLLNDPTFTGGMAVPRNRRYIKVVHAVSGEVFYEGVDFVIIDDPTAGPQISKFVSGGTIFGSIQDGDPLEVSYLTAETFTYTFTYPQFLAHLGNRLQETKPGGADVLAKAMLPNYVDMNLSVTVEDSPTSTPAVMDPKIRTAISLAISLTGKRLSQSDIVGMVSAIPGVTRVDLPLGRMAKADGSSVIGEIIPTGTVWESPEALHLPGTLFPVSTHSWVTRDPVLSCSTIPSGGTPTSFVGLLHEGKSFRRCRSLAEFAAAQDAAFYIIGLNDAVGPTAPVAAQHYRKVLLHLPGTDSPSLFPYRVTYQVFGEASARDITASPLEYLLPGQIIIHTKTEGQS